MTNSERINNLKKFGYTEREAEFVSIAALNSGYFVRRQFLFFIGKCRGQIAASFIDRAIQNGHARALTFRGDRTVYHVASKVVYEALGDPDNRNRRQHEIFTIKNRLIALDFVLQNRAHRFLGTEREKTAYFSEELKIERHLLPFKRYHSQENNSTTDRFFVDKSPIFAPETRTEAVCPLHFCYIDEGQHTTSRFERHLREYHSLFVRLSRFELVYVACAPDQFEASRRLFERMILNGSNGVPIDPHATRLIGFFRDRVAYESRNFTHFDQAKLIQFRADRAAFTRGEHEQLFAEWKAGGDAAVIARMCPEAASKPRSEARFSTYLMRFNYDLFGTLLNGTRESNACTKQTAS